MEITFYLLIVFFVISLFSSPLFLRSKMVRAYLKKDLVPSSNILETERILHLRCAYYQLLPPQDRKRFLLRTIRFMESKDFSAREGLVLSSEMKILISASAIQLTFGLDEYTFDHFHQVVIYPKAYYNQQTERWHKGEVSLAGAIVLSWKSFKSGYDNPGDNVNLGLHEMAHALRFDKFKGDDYDQFFAQYFDKWYLVAKEEFTHLRKHEPSFFRDYGGTNINEFFSVCVEYFFESSAAFKEKLPEIYKHMCILLNQDPTKKFSSEHPVREQLLPHCEVTELKEPLLFRSSSPGLVLPSVSFLLFPAALLGPFVGALEAGNPFALIIISLVLLTVLYLFINKTYKRFYIYQNALVIRFPLFQKPKMFVFEELVRLSMQEETSSMQSNSMEISYLEKERIRSRLFIIFMEDKELRQIADLLTAKKIPVMIKGFKEAFKD